MGVNQLRDEIKHHPSNAAYLSQGFGPVFTASEEAKIVIIGQAPGRAAQESGIPWNDVSGDNLRAWLDISRDTFYDESKIALVPMDFYFPGKGKSGDLPPRKDFAPMWHHRVFLEMKNIRCAFLVGQYAQRYYLGDVAKRNLTETVRSYKEYLPIFLPLVHPSPLTIRWQKKNPWFAEEVLPDAKALVSSLLG